MIHPLLDRLRFLGQLAPSEQPALVSGDSRLDYAGLIEAIIDAVTWLQGEKAEVVALQAENGVDWVVIDLACQVAGVVCLPLPDFFSVEQCRNSLVSAGADLLISDNRAVAASVDGSPLPATGTVLPSLRGLMCWQLPAAASRGNRPAGTSKITFTSGSTGAPSGVCLSLEHQWQVAESLAVRIDVDHPRHLCLLPLATLLENIAGVYTPLLCSGTVLLPDSASRGLSGSSGLNVEALTRCLDRCQPDTMILLPQLLSALVAACQQGWRPPVSLKFVAVGGARVAPELIRSARGWGIPVYEGYGLSECGSVVALNTPARDLPGTAGRVLEHCAVTIEDGEIIVTGACHLGYLEQPDSWYPVRIATGDLGSLASDGQLTIDGRRKNLLISSFGRNISPEWVETALGAQPLLSHCVVLGDGRPHLAALLSAPAAVPDGAIARWIAQVNRQLPDYARIHAWHRLDAEAWSGLLTANGRPRRQQISQSLAPVIERLYETGTTALPIV